MDGSFAICLAFVHIVVVRNIRIMLYVFFYFEFVANRIKFDGRLNEYVIGFKINS